MVKLEDFYLNFNKGQDGGLSSNPKQVRKTELHKIMEACRIEENRGNEARQNLEAAQSRLNHLHSIKDKGPLAITLELDVASMDGQQQTSPSEIGELKNMFASFKMLEDKYQKSIKWKNSCISFDRLFKIFLITNTSFVPTYLKSKRRNKELAKHQILKDKALKEPVNEQ